jgi:hypothetical protein
VGVGLLGIGLGQLDPRTLIGLWLVERLALEQCACQGLEPPALALEELGHLFLGAVDDSADLLVDQLLGRGRGR